MPKDTSYIQVNYTYFYAVVAPKLRGQARRIARCDDYTAAEIINETADLFVSRFRPQGEAQAIKYGRLCLLRHCRDAGLVSRDGGAARRDLIVSIGKGGADIPVPFSVPDLADRLPLGLDATCRAAIDLLLQGHTQRETALELGLSVSSLRRRLLALVRG